MSRRGPWATLGIDATTDERAIKRAYAAKLKAIDVDADPQGFAALRQALQAARAHAARAYAAPEPEPAPEPQPEVVAEPAEPAPPPVKPGWLEDIEAVQALVYGDRPRADIFAEVEERTARLLSDPAMENIDHATHAERWAAELILSALPRTNGLLRPAMERFGWLEAAQRWDCPPLIRAVVERYRDVEFVARTSDAPDGLGPAYRLLLDPTSRPSARHAAAVERLLTGIRTRRRTVERELDPNAVAAWARIWSGAAPGRSRGRRSPGGGRAPGSGAGGDCSRR